MSFKSNKGYSLIEIGVGLLILTVFLVCSVALFNGSYSTYRMIQQRNIATDLAVTTMETMLQTDADVLTGFFVEEYNSDDGIVEIKPNPNLVNFIIENDWKFDDRYSQIIGEDVSDFTTLSIEDIEEYIYKDKDYVINAYVQLSVENNYYNDSIGHNIPEDVLNGNYGLLVDSVTEEGALNDPITHNNMIIRKTILRLPIYLSNDIEDDWIFGNNVLKIKVEVIFTNKVNNQNVTEEDLKSVVLETIKIAN